MWASEWRRGLRAGLTGDAEDAPQDGLAAKARAAGAKAREGGDAILESGRELRGALDRRFDGDEGEPGATPARSDAPPPRDEA